MTLYDAAVRGPFLRSRNSNKDYSLFTLRALCSLTFLGHSCSDPGLSEGAPPGRLGSGCDDGKGLLRSLTLSRVL